MGSPITFSGFNNIDWGQVLNAVMAQEQVPLTSLQTHQTALQTQSGQFGTLATRLGKLASAASDLSKAHSLQVVTATSRDATAVGVSTTGGTIQGTYDVVVSELARAQVTASTSTYASTDALVASGGSLSLQVAGKGPVSVPVTGNMTLSALAEAINGATGSPATASIIQSAPGTYRLVLAGQTGLSGAFTITNGLTGGLGLAFTDTNADGVSGDSAADNAVSAIDAEFTVNNVSVRSATNTVDAAVPGATLTLLKKGPDAIRVDVARDSAEAAASAKTFVSAYNDLLSFYADQKTAAAAGKANIARDPLVLGLQGSLRSALSAEHLGGTYTRLAAVGLGFSSTGKLTLDEDVFSAAIASHPDDVQKLFSGAAGGAGAFGALDTLVESYTQSGGLVSDARTRITAQVASISGRLDDMQARLDVRRLALQREYTATDLAMTQLNNSVSSLSSLNNQYRLF